MLYSLHPPLSTTPNQPYRYTPHPTPLTLLLLPAATACCDCPQELCEGDLVDFTRAMRHILYDQASGAPHLDALAPLLLVRRGCRALEVLEGWGKRGVPCLGSGVVWGAPC